MSSPYPTLLSMGVCDFFIIGAAKAGTTSMHQRLAAHPDLFMTQPKEPEFFARDELYAKGLSFYAKLFEGRKDFQVSGESSTLYSLSPLFPDTPSRIKSACPDAKFVYMIREPVSRTFSYYRQIVKNYQNATKDYVINRTFEDCLFKDRAKLCPREYFFAPFDNHLPDVPELFLAGSRYLSQIQTYLIHFPREHFHFLTFEEFVANQDLACQKILEFLDINPEKMPKLPQTSLNRAEAHLSKIEKTVLANDYVKKIGLLAEVQKLFPKTMRQNIRDCALKLLPKNKNLKHVPAPPKPETIEWLKKEFYGDIDTLSRITGLDLSHWISSNSRLYPKYQHKAIWPQIPEK